MDSKMQQKQANSRSFDQGLEFRQENFPRNRIFRIFPPTSQQCKNPQAHNFRIDSIATKTDLMISNLPLVERAHLQKYNVKCNEKNYSIMLDAPKYIFDAYHFNFESHGTKLSKTHYFAIAPNLANQENEPSLPILYRMSVCREIDNPQHFSFSMYAIVGGYSDGFYFMSRLDNDIPEYAHIKKCKNKHCKKVHHTGECKQTPEIIDFPHIHRPDFNHCHSYVHEFSTPTHIPELKNRSFYDCLGAYMKLNNVSSQMMLVQEDLSISQLLNCVRVFEIKDKIRSADLGKIAMSDLTQFESYTEHKQSAEALPEQECGAPYLRP